MKFILAALAIFAAAAGPARADSAAALLDRLEGDWVAAGEAFGAPADSQMRWTPTLGGKFMRLEYRIEMRPAGKEPSVFEGVAFYDRVDGERAFWADNSGDLHPIRAETDGAALIAHWGVAGAKQGRTRYEATVEGKVAVTDWLLTKEGWRRFNATTFERRKDD